MQPGVLAYPHRDGGSVVAHGLAMSVNGQDPRSNVYLLDGTLQNDFTNGPAGSAAGTALGTETIREFRVESNAYSAEFGRNSGGQINVLTKSGANNVDGSRTRVPSQRGARRPQLFRRRRAARLPSQPVRRHDRRTDRARPGVLLPRLRGAGRAARQDDQHGRARRQRAHRTAAERAGARQPAGRALPRGVPHRQRTVARAGPRQLHVPVQPADRRALRAGPGRLQLRRRHASCSPATRSTIPISSCPPTIRSFRATSSRGTSSSPPSTGSIVSPNTLSTSRIGFSRTRIGQNVQANTSQPLPVFVRDARQHGRHRHRRPAAFRPAELGQPPPRAERLQRAERPGPARAAATCSRPGRWPSTTRTTWSTRRSASASSRSPT